MQKLDSILEVPQFSFVIGLDRTLSNSVFGKLKKYIEISAEALAI
jgi:hypothetical protein